MYTICTNDVFLWWLYNKYCWQDYQVVRQDRFSVEVAAIPISRPRQLGTLQKVTARMEEGIWHPSHRTTRMLLFVNWEQLDPQTSGSVWMTKLRKIRFYGVMVPSARTRSGLLTNPTTGIIIRIVWEWCSTGNGKIKTVIEPTFMFVKVLLLTPLIPHCYQ